MRQGRVDSEGPWHGMAAMSRFWSLNMIIGLPFDARAGPSGSAVISSTPHNATDTRPLILPCPNRPKVLAPYCGTALKHVH